MTTLIDPTELVISELVTNAVRVSEGLKGCRYDGQWVPGTPPVRFWLVSDCERAVIHVWDASDVLPEAQDVELDAESGRGLLLVTTLSNDWGIYRPEAASGKVVWAWVDQ